MAKDKNLKSLKAEFLKAVYDYTQNEAYDIGQRKEAVKKFRQDWADYIKENKSSTETSLTDIGISDSPGLVLINMRKIALTDLEKKVKALSEDQTSDISERADKAFALMRDVEDFGKTFRKAWNFAYPENSYGGIKEIFEYEAITMRTFGSLKAGPQLVYDLNIAAARHLYQEMLQNPKVSVLQANDRIFNHMIQAGFDDISAHSLNNGRYEHDVEVFIRALDPDTGWDDFWRKMSDLAIARGELKEPTSYFGPMPNKDTGDFGAGKIASPSKAMRYFAATR